tara:strand:+ start:2251 stop:2850 length:600 start_codon:yes stop_codon:yes gene_type:complete
MENRKKEIKNFIGIYDNYIPESACDEAIKFFEEQSKFNKTLTRLQFENAPHNMKKDKQYFASPDTINVWWESLKNLIVNCNLAFNEYNKETGIVDAYGGNDFHFAEVKIQKTLPTEGYHVWHVENQLGFNTEPRVLVYSVYLNNVEEGGETEFLHFSKRVKPKKGRIVIWPAGFPYLHRGNSPLSGEKYILTSWIKLRP